MLPAMLTAMVSRRSPPAEAPPPRKRAAGNAGTPPYRSGGASRRWSLGSGQLAAGLQRETIAGNNLFLLHVVVQSTSD